MVQKNESEQVQQVEAGQKTPDQEDLEAQIDALKFEIEAVNCDLEQTKKAKAAYVLELTTDPVAQERRLELLAGGYQGVSEYSENQLSKVNNFINTIRRFENTILERQRTIEHLQKTIVAQQERQTALLAIDEPIKNFNRSLAQLKKTWEDLKATASEHDIELLQQEFPGEAFLFEGQKRLGSSPYVHWLTIGFEEE